jgi:hypothetical protein
MDGASGRWSRKDSSLRKTSCERLYAVFSKRGASGRHKLEADWKGNFIEGAGRLNLGSGSFEDPYSFKRTQGVDSMRRADGELWTCEIRPEHFGGPTSAPGGRTTRWACGDYGLAIHGNEMSILDLLLAAISLAPLGFLFLFWRMFPDDRGIHPIYRDSRLKDTQKDRGISTLPDL